MRILLAAVGVALWAPPLPAQNGPEPSALVRRAIDAAGGADKLKRAPRILVRSEGTLTVRGQAVPFTSRDWCEPGVRYRSELTLAAPGGELVEIMVFADGAGWSTLNDTLRRADGKNLERGLTGVYLEGVISLLPLVTDPGFTLAVAGHAEVASRPADGVRVARPGRPDVTLWFDRGTGLLAQYTATSPVGVQDHLLLEYKDFGGVKRPTRRVRYNAGVKTTEERITEYKVLDALDPGLFREPGAALAADPRPAADPREVLRRHVAATGGADLQRKLRCEYTRETARLFNSPGCPTSAFEEVETEIWVELPTAARQVRTRVETVGGKKVTRTQVYADGKGWLQEAGRPARPLTADEALDWQETLAVGWGFEVAPLADDPVAKLTSAGRGEVAGRPAVGVRVVRVGWPDMTLWFDAQTHRLVRKDDRDPSSSAARETLYSEYTERDGVRRPTRIEIRVAGKKTAEGVIADHRHSERLDPALLTRPKE
jgi:hypothetical protein